jgi:hypothetical protein
VGNAPDAAGQTAAPLPPPALAWSWTDAARGLAFAAPTLVVTTVNPQIGLPLAVGVLPGCLLPLPGPRRARILIFLIGSLIGFSLFVGGAIAHLPTVASAAALVAGTTAAALSATRVRGGQIILTLVAPLTAAGLSYGDDWTTPVAAALLLAAGSLFAWLVSLAWPERPATTRAPQPLPDRPTMLRYGLLLGSGAAVAYLIASALRVDHPGWAPAACLLVARPVTGLLKTRAAGRSMAVTLGALASMAVVAAELPNPVLAGIAGATVIAAAATRASRWYITSAFTTFSSFSFCSAPTPTKPSRRCPNALVKLFSESPSRSSSASSSRR